MIHIVLGMHKSGTTLVSECLHHSGIPMVEDGNATANYDGGQKWEREATKSFNHLMLGSAGAHSIAVGGRRVSDAGLALEGLMRGLGVALSAAHPTWGFKDPRTCLTYEAWARVLPNHRLIAVYRDPWTVLAHYRKQAEPDSRTFDAGQVLARWCEYNHAIIHYVTHSTKPALVLRYENLMRSHDEFQRLETFIGKPLRDMRNPALMRSASALKQTGFKTWAERLWLGDSRVRRVLAQLERLSRA